MLFSTLDSLCFCDSLIRDNKINIKTLFNLTFNLILLFKIGKSEISLMRNFQTLLIYLIFYSFEAREVRKTLLICPVLRIKITWCEIHIFLDL